VVAASALEQRDSDLNNRQGRVIQHPVPHHAAPAVETPRCASSSRRIGFLGRLHPKKRIGDLIDAFTGLYGDATLVIGGNQPLEEFARLRDRVAVDGLGARVCLLGFIAPDDRSAFFTSVDVLVMPSTYECFGMVAAEALSAGVPVIVTEQTGIAEVVRHHDAGVVVPVGDPDAIRAAIERILADPDALTIMRDNARRAARIRLSFGAYADAIRTVYDEVTQ
jgi:glycosyltransferase involved in cell wall biosynthesis